MEMWTSRHPSSVYISKCVADVTAPTWHPGWMQRFWTLLKTLDSVVKALWHVSTRAVRRKSAQWSGRSCGWFLHWNSRKIASFKVRQLTLILCVWRILLRLCSLHSLITEQTGVFGWAIHHAVMHRIFLSRRLNRYLFMIPCGWSVILMTSCTDTICQEPTLPDYKTVLTAAVEPAGVS